jgi:hypothetical protein
MTIDLLAADPFCPIRRKNRTDKRECALSMPSAERLSNNILFADLELLPKA